VPRAADDYDALALAGVVLGAGSGLTGRIPERIREREGLAYTASAATVAGAGIDPGRLVLYVATSAATVAQAERGLREELARFVDEGPSDEEVADARAYLAGREPFRRETARQLADLIVRAEHVGLPLDRPGWREQRLARLTRADVHAAVRRHLRPEALQVTVGLPAPD
jgi:zinc protease